MSNYYIIFTDNIRPVGGQQLYTLGKAEYLEKQGWNVVVINPTHKTGNCGFEGLNKYLKNGLVSLFFVPSELSKFVRNALLNRLVKICNISKNHDNIYIESQYSKGSLWAEFFAKKVHGKHVIFNCGENFRGKEYFYEDLIDFYKFKYYRKELYGISNVSVNRLFEGYDVDIPQNHDFFFNAVEPEAVKDIETNKLDTLNRLDWNIMYIGRGEKGYVPSIITGVYRFASIHQDKKINFIVIGNMDSRKDELEKLEKSTNVIVNVLGEMVPIPREVFKFSDVVIAGAGCAELSAYEGIKTIIADAKNFNAVGVFGYDTTSLFFSDDTSIQHGYEYYLEKLLVDHQYDNQKCNLPQRYNLSDEVEKQLTFFSRSNENNYMDVTKCNINRPQNRRKMLRLILSDIKGLFCK